MSDVVAIDTLDLDTLNDGPFFLAASHSMAHFYRLFWSELDVISTDSVF